MLLRVLILLIAFNAIIPSAFAIGAMKNCQMEMDDANLVSRDSTADMSCCTMTDMEKNCCAIQCSSGCSVNISNPLPLGNAVTMVFKSTPTQQPQFKMANFYQIILPVYTPPPLV